MRLISRAANICPRLPITRTHNSGITRANARGQLGDNAYWERLLNWLLGLHPLIWKDVRAPFRLFLPHLCSLFARTATAGLYARFLRPGFSRSSALYGNCFQPALNARALFLRGGRAWLQISSRTAGFAPIFFFFFCLRNHFFFSG